MRKILRKCALNSSVRKGLNKSNPQTRGWQKSFLTGVANLLNFQHLNSLPYMYQKNQKLIFL